MTEPELEKKPAFLVLLAELESLVNERASIRTRMHALHRNRDAEELHTLRMKLENSLHWIKRIVDMLWNKIEMTDAERLTMESHLKRLAKKAGNPGDADAGWHIYAPIRERAEAAANIEI